MTQPRYAVIEKQGNMLGVEATFPNKPFAKAAAREFCKEMAERGSAQLDNMVVEEDRVTFEEHDYVAKITEVKAYSEGETL